MRQDLMRQQALEEEHKETQKKQQQLLRFSDSSSPICVSVPSSCIPPAQVPVEVLKVRGVNWNERCQKMDASERTTQKN